MHDLNSAANTDDSSGIDSAAHSSDFEVNMIIKEFESEFLLQVAGVLVCVWGLAVCCGADQCSECGRLGCVSDTASETAKYRSACWRWQQVHIAPEGACLVCVDCD
jgi:hypothetical protein